MIAPGIGQGGRDPAIARAVLEHMGITPWVLRDRVAAPIAKAPPAIAVPADAQVVRVPEPERAPIVIPKPEPVVAKPAEPAEHTESEPAVSDRVEPVFFACMLRGELLVMAQLPSWSNGLLEHVSAGFLKDLLGHLPDGEAPRDVMAINLPDQTQDDVRAMVQGRLMRERGRGVKRCLLLSDLSALVAPAVPTEMALFEAPGLQTLWESGSAKQALWALVQRLSGSV